jgi:DNA-directed RNA polymerase subunit beta'
MKKLVETNQCNNIKSAKRRVERADSKVWDVLEEVIKDHPVLLNRAPTLHRLSIQAFEPVLIEGRALKLHPLACTAFNADFDGDQMAVHVPLSVAAQAEARYLMLASNNILKLSDGQPVVLPSQDMVMGSYYLTIDKEGAKGEGKFFSDPDEAIMAYQVGEVELQALINVRVTKEFNGEKITGIVKTTVGRIIFNEAIPQDLGYVERKTKEDALKYEIDFLVGKNQLKDIVAKCFKLKGTTPTAELLDKIKALGYKYSTIGAITTSVFDMHIPKEKPEIINNAEKKVVEIEDMYEQGFITDEERYKQVVSVWENATNEVTGKMKGTLSKFNPIWMMANSGARGNMNQIRQLSGMRGLMSDPSGKTIELPVKACFREGLSVLEYFISSHGGRKGLADTALKTADSGYLTRRLVDVSQDVIVREEDCCAGSHAQGVWVSAITGDKKEEVIEKLEDRIAGRWTIDDVVNPATGEVIVPADTMINDDQAKAITKAGIEKVFVRSILTCKSKQGICAKCYGKNMANGKPVNLGEAVGVIAAQSIGEPGTQLTMRTFHTGGVATGADITRGLPRIEELFEARKPKGVALVCEVNGTVSIVDSDNKREIVVSNPNGEGKTYQIAKSSRLKVNDGDVVEAGTILTEGSVYPQDLLRTKGIKAVQEYLVKEVQSVYRMQGVEINDKHVEVIVRQMLRKVKVEDSGDTDLLPGELVDIFKFDDENMAALEKGGRPAAAKRTLLGITKASLATDSFLAAAAFQETSRVLTEAAIRNKVDALHGLKENVIIGKLIPAGTGLKEYRNIEVQSNVDYSADDTAEKIVEEE